MRSARRWTRRAFGRAALVALGGAALAACRAPGDAAGGRPVTSPGTTGGAGWAPDRVVKVGIVLPASGVLASVGAANLAGMRLALAEYEARGWRFQTILEDTRGEPTPALRAVQKLIERDQVDFLLGPVSSGVLPVLRDPVDEAGLVLSVSQAATREVTGSRCSRWIFRAVPTNYMTAYGFGPWVAQHLGRRAYVLTADFTAGIEWADAFLESFEAAGGTAVSYARAPMSTTDFAPYMGALLEARPDVVVGQFAGRNAIDLVKAFAQFGVKERMRIAYSGYLTENDVIETQGAADTEGIYGYMHFSESLDTAEYRAWAARLQALAPEIGRPAAYTVNGYNATRAVLLGIEGARSLASAAVAAAMESVEFVGPTGPIRFGPSHQATLDYYVTRVEGLRHVVLDRVPSQSDPASAECVRTW